MTPSLNTRRCAVLALAASLTLPVMSSAKAQSGEEAFKECAACHSVVKGENQLGPSLNGIVGRAAASVAGYRYSNAMKAQKFAWTEAKLDEFIANPQATVRGTRMPYSGMSDQKERAALIAWLKTQTN